jgi:hypothetical protein
MIEIKDLLLRFNNLLLSEEVKKESIRDVIRDVIKIQINIEDIEVKNSIIYLNIKPIYKNEIFLKKEELFFKLKEILGKKTPQDFK